MYSLYTETDALKAQLTCLQLCCNEIHKVLHRRFCNTYTLSIIEILKVVPYANNFLKFNTLHQALHCLIDLLL